MQKATGLILVSIWLWTAAAAGCSGRSLGAHSNDTPDGSVPVPDARTQLDGAIEDLCPAQNVGFCPDACVDIVGYFWNGQNCSPIICCCEGPDCHETYATFRECIEDRLHCVDNACADAGGYCNDTTSEFRECIDGYGRNFQIEQDNPGVCGPGICCTPCPDPDDPLVWYAGFTDEECNQIDWDCFDPDFVNFHNECGCGCRPL
jgi:hypothetical protein